jgi:hypothetical protein
MPRNQFAHHSAPTSRQRGTHTPYVTHLPSFPTRPNVLPQHATLAIGNGQSLLYPPEAPGSAVAHVGNEPGCTPAAPAAAAFISASPHLHHRSPSPPWWPRLRSEPPQIAPRQGRSISPRADSRNHAILECIAPQTRVSICRAVLNRRRCSMRCRDGPQHPAAHSSPACRHRD